MSLTEIILIAALGLGAGLAGGLAGIGGSIITLPGLHVVLTRAQAHPELHHTFMAAAMTAALFVATPSALSHYRAGAVRTPYLKRLITGTVLGVVAGVLLSNAAPVGVLKFLLGCVILWYALRTLARVVRPRRRAFTGEGRVEHASTPKLVVIGLVVGLFSGLLGIGGGVILVPLLQIVCNVKLRNAIATSSAVVCFTVTTGATVKLLSLHALGQSPAEALSIALVLIPTAMIGGWVGAKLTHALPLVAVRSALVVLFLATVARMAGLWGQPPEIPDTDAPPAHVALPND